jgi:hypothetical protein
MYVPKPGRVIEFGTALNGHPALGRAESAPLPTKNQKSMSTTQSPIPHVGSYAVDAGVSSSRSAPFDKASKKTDGKERMSTTEEVTQHPPTSANAAIISSPAIADFAGGER